MTGQEGEIPTSVSGGGGSTGPRASDVQRQQAADNLEASQALQDVLGIVTESNRSTRELIKTVMESRKSGDAPDFTSGKSQSRINPWLSTGGGQDEAQFYYRKLALTDPTAYEQARTNALTTIKESIQSVFDTTLAQYQDAGYSIQDAEVKALEAAKSSREIQMKALATKFGMNDNLYMEGAHKNAAAFKVGR